MRKMSNTYLFDVDGTLTPSRQSIDPEFARWFKQFARQNDVYLVTGSDRSKTIEQIGEEVYYLCKRVYQCSGNDVWEGGTNIRTNVIEYDEKLDEALTDRLNLSRFPFKTGRHIEYRPGLINYSIVGRNASLEERSSYVDWDKRYDERDEIAYIFSDRFPKYRFQVAGETGIDITIRGFGKDQVLTDFKDYARIVFIGDKTEYGGNDHEIFTEVLRLGGQSYSVNNWKQTWEILKTSELA
jgi:phosphomannomutase